MILFEIDKTRNKYKFSLFNPLGTSVRHEIKRHKEGLCREFEADASK